MLLYCKGISTGVLSRDKSLFEKYIYFCFRKKNPKPPSKQTKTPIGQNGIAAAVADLFLSKRK